MTTKFKRIYHPRYTLTATSQNTFWKIIIVANIIIASIITIRVIISNNEAKETITPLHKNPQTAPQTSQGSIIDSQTQTQSTPTNLSTYYVSRVIDGDTIVVKDGTGEQKVRMIGIDTPETKNPNKPVECYGSESSNYLTNLLTGKTVFLESDNSQSDVDIYGRLLRYVYYDDQNINLLMISSGFAYEYLFNSAYKYRDSFIKAENEARDNQKGLWSPLTCGGQR